jgi:type I restriction enzyme S subunit
LKLEPTVQAKHNFQTRNSVLHQTRDLLLPRLISGELDVSDLPIDTGADDAN